MLDLSTFLSDKSQVHWAGTVLWTGDLNLFSGLSFRYQTTTNSESLSSPPTPPAKKDFNTLQWTGWPDSVFWSARSIKYIPNLWYFQFMAVGLLGMESTIKWRNRRRTNVWTPPSHIPAESPKAGSESQGAFPKGSSKDSAGLAPWCSSFVFPKPASLSGLGFYFNSFQILPHTYTQFPQMNIFCFLWVWKVEFLPSFPLSTSHPYQGF